MQKTAVHFGAGNIGRGFIGMILSQAAYRVIFVDVAEPLVHEIRQRGRYTVQVAGESLQSIDIEGVEARLSSDPELPEILASASLITTAVGANFLVHVAQSIAAGFARQREQEREQEQSRVAAQYIIACENMIRGSSSLKQAVESELQATGGQLPAYVYFPDAAVDRVVPALENTGGDILAVRVEQYSEWLVEGTAQQCPELAEISGLQLVADLTPFLKRKIYTVNTGHACAAWHGFRLGYPSVNEALSDKGIRELVAGAQAESSRGLCAEYGMAVAEMRQFSAKSLRRFQNPYIIDDVLRVGRQPLRKLGPEERIDGPLKLAQKHGDSGEYLLRGAAAALLFRNEVDPEACELQELLNAQGPELVLRQRFAHLGGENLAKIRQYYREYKAL